MIMGEWIGLVVFLLAPVVLGGILLWYYPDCRRIRLRSLLVYVLTLLVILWAALEFVAFVASARLPLRELAIVTWFTISVRLAWELWRRSVGRAGQRWVRWARLRKYQGKSFPGAIRFIPFARGLFTASVFFPVFFTFVATHRPKLADGQDPQRVFNIPYQSVKIPTGDGLLLDGWFIREEGAERTILVCHGAGANKGNFIWFLAPLRGEGYNVMFFDFRGHGSSDGRIITYGIREKLDVLAAVAWLKEERPEQSKRIVGLGSSLGSMALALAAAEEPRIDAVVLDSPFVSPRSLLHSHARLVPAVGPVVCDWLLLLVSFHTGTDFFDVSAERSVASLGKRPVFIVHGDKDIGMPAEHAKRLHEAAKGPKAIWFGPGPHSNIITTAPSKYKDRLFTFLEKHFGPAD
jgi:pimeloyl-ACP methyl ester carboxylesterase